MKHRFTLLFALLCASMMTWAAEWTGQVTGTATNVWLDGIGSNEERTEVNYTVNYLVEYNAETLTITLGYTEDNFNKTVGLVPQVFVNGAYKGNFSDVTWSSIEFASGQVLDIHFFFAYNEGSSNSSHFSYTIPSDGGGEGGEGTEPEPGVIDWNTVNWLGNGIDPEDEEYNNKYKAVVTPDLTGTGINNLQPNGGHKCIHIAFPSAEFGTISLSNSQYHTEGAGMFVHLDAFTYKQTEFTIENNGTTYTFTVYYADGQEGSAVMVPEIYDVNFALASNGATATASSGNADAAIDGNVGTRWESDATDNETFTLNMGKARTFNYVRINWEGAFCSQFELTYSTDGVAYQPLYTETALAAAGWQEIYFETPVTAQYIKYHGTKRATGYGQSFWEFEVLLQEGAPMTNIAVGKSIYASSAGANDVNRVVDGNGGTEWQGSVTNGTTNDEAARTYDAWFVVDLGAFYDIAKVSIVFEGACSQAYHVDFSADANTWKQVFEHNGNAGVNGHTKDIKFTVDNKKVRYVRFWSTKAATEWGMKIFEFQVFGTLAATPTKTVSASVNDATMGSATVKKEGEAVDEVTTGSEVTFSAVANDGYIFVEWSNGEKNATFTTTVDAALNLTATFRQLGTTYCNTLVQSTNDGQTHDAYVTMKRTAENEYTLVVRSTEAMLNFGGTNFYMQPNTHVIDLRNQGTLSADKRTLIATFSAEKEPYMTTPLYVVLDGGFDAHFPRLTNIEFAVSCEDNVEVESIALDPSEATIEIGESKTLVPLFTPAYAIDQTVSWSSNKESIVSVSSDGVIVGNAVGEAVITATSANGKTATCNVTVNTITEKTWWGLTTIAEWDNMPVMYSITRNIDRTLTYTVYFGGDASGKVMQINNGAWNALTGYTDLERKASFTTTTTYESGTQIKPDHFFYFGGPRIELADEYVVGASNEKPSTAVESVVISHSTASLMKDETIQLVASVVPAYADDKTLIWSSEDTNIATVDNNGLVTAIAEGATTITATSVNGKTASCVVTVVGALEPATWYGVTTIQVNGNPVGVNYSITRTSERKLQFYYSLAESIVGLANTSVVFKGTPDIWNTMMKLDANERTAEFTSESTYIDGSTIGIFFHLPFTGGVGRWDVDYVVGSSNEKPNTLVAFGDQADNTAKIAEYADKVVDAYINRTFPNTDEWYTLCLPFDMDETLLAATFGAGYTLATLGSSEDRGSLIHLNFDYVNTLEAGKPYLLRPGVSTATVPMIEAVTIKNVDPSAAPQKAESAHMHFQGTFAPTTLEGDNKRFVGPNNYLYSPAEGGTNMKSFRCYFTIPVESQALVGSKAARIVFGPQVSTGTENVQSDQVQSTKVIIDGTLYIIRGERTYNAQGQLVK